MPSDAENEAIYEPEAASLHSATAALKRQERDEQRQSPILLLVGDPDSIGPQRDARIVKFDQGIAIGRHPPRNHKPWTHIWEIKDKTVSSRHAGITRVDGGGYDISDLGSTNGTVVDGSLVKEPARLHDGAVVFVGNHVAVFRVVTEVQLEAMELELKKPFGPVATTSPELAMACERLRRLAVGGGELLITGETGVGKEVYARAIHERSGRGGKLVAINCAALPRELVESELFGYVRGAHSQARESKTGLLEEADGGTLFLDEIGEMASELQTKLLRFTQDRQFLPVGGTQTKRLDVRILAATSRTGPPTTGPGPGLRADLYARLGAEPIRLPALKERIEDVGALAAHFLDGVNRPFELVAYQALCLYTWPGNVRELEKVVTTAEVLARETDRIGPRHLPAAIAVMPDRARAESSNRPPQPDAAQLEALLRRFDGNVARVARELDRKPALIYRWIQRFHLSPDDYRRKPT